MVRKLFIAGVALSVVVVLASLGRANPPLGPYPTPGGGIVIPGPNPIVITGDRLNHPLANQAIPGTQGNFAHYVPGVGWVHGTTYIGQDGKPHGTTVVPNGMGGNITTHYFARPSSGPGSVTPQRPAPTTPQIPGMRPTPPRIR